MGVKGGFSVECSGPCAAKDRHGHGRKLGDVERGDDGRAVWGLDWGRKFNVTWTDEGATATPREGAMRWAVESGDREYRVTCDRCGRVWIFTVEELTARYGQLAGRRPPVALAGVDVGRPVGG